MSGHKETSDGHMQTRQLSLFDSPSASVAGLDAVVKASMATVAAASNLSREQICDRMEVIANRSGVRICPAAKRLSVALLEKWLNPAEREHMPSIRAVQIFCIAMNTSVPWEAVLHSMGLGVLTPEILRVYKIGQAQLDLEAARKRLRTLNEKS